MTRIRIVGAADLHIDARHLTSLDDQWRALLDVVGVVRESRAQVVALAGDLTHYRQPRPQALELIGRFLELLSEEDVEVVIVSGNHDPEVAGVAQHFVGRVHIAREPRVIQLACGLDVAALPYLPDAYVRAMHDGRASKEDIAALLTKAVEQIVEGFLAQRRPGRPLVFVGHGTVQGTATSGGWQMGFQGGTEWRLPVQELARFDLAIVGHVHRHQEPAPGVVVPGSLLPLDFSETDPHGVIDAEVYAGESAVWRFAPVTAPTVATWEWDDKKVRQQCSMPAVFNGHPIDLLRVRISCSEATAREFPAAVVSEQLYRAGARKVQVEYEIASADRARDAGATIDLGPVGALDRYLRQGEGTPAAAIVELRERAAVVIAALEQETTVAGGGGDLELIGLEAENFLGIGVADLDLRSAGLYALTGDVGAGKSTIGSDVARFALFGSSRYGTRPTDRVVRQGAESGLAAVTLRSTDGHEYRVVRKVRRSARGAVSTLDVFSKNGAGWTPMTTAKVADGNAAIARILGGLSDETLTTSSIVIQRAADSLTRVPADGRKRIIAEAAGLGIYDALAEASRERLRQAQRDLELLHREAVPVRARIQSSVDDEAALAAAGARAVALETAIAEGERALEALRAQRERAAARVTEYDRVDLEAARVSQDVAGVEAEIDEHRHKLTAAKHILAERTQLEAAKGELAKVKARIAELETAQERDAEQLRRRAAAVSTVATIERELVGIRSARERLARDLDRDISAATAKTALLGEAECCAPEPSCVFLGDARAAAAAVPQMQERLAAASAITVEELALVERIQAIEVPPESAGNALELRAERSKAEALEKAAAVAEKIARAEEIEKSADEAIAAAQRRGESLRVQLRLLRAQTITMGSPRSELARYVSDATAVEGSLAARRSEMRTNELERGRLGALVQALEQDREALARLEVSIGDGAHDAAAWDALGDAWKACRVLVLETSVIPAIESTANDVLRRFPYGLQLAFRTQRDTKGGGVSETLDIEVLGGHAPIYEGLSGGQRTAVDFALHVAIALVVSRRASARLRFLFADEPEGLDEPGRAAFAATARWIHETLGLTVLVASHATDLVDALGATQIAVEQHETGSTAVMA